MDTGQGTSQQGCSHRKAPHLGRLKTVGPVGAPIGKAFQEFVSGEGAISGMNRAGRRVARAGWMLHWFYSGMDVSRGFVSSLADGYRLLDRRRRREPAVSRRTAVPIAKLEVDVSGMGNAGAKFGSMKAARVK